jgi:C1A family cysteine protease
MKKLLSALLALVILISCVPMLAYSADGPVDNIVPDGTVVIPADGEEATVLSVDPTKMQINGGNYDSQWFASSYKSPYITSVKNQNPYGTCWAHSSCSLAETWLWQEGLGGSGTNLSEQQLAYFIYKDRYDPLGNLSGDYTKYKGTNSAFNEGANFFIASLAMASWLGLTYETNMPYGNPSTYYAPASAYNGAFRMTDVRWFSMSDIKTAKHYIIENGAIGADYYSNDSYYQKKSSTAYYYPYSSGTNHAITIVGWDDNYSASNFKYNPGKNGAWLVKNSWGTSWGDNGYFWLSYYDKPLTANSGFAMQFTNATKYENNYQYDGSGSYCELTMNNNCYVANTYTVNAYAYERLDAVMFGVASTNTNYTIQIYKNVTDFTKMNGTPLLSSPLSGSTTEPGMYTVDLGTDSILLKKGDTITVCIQFRSLNSDKVAVLVDLSDNTSTYYNHVNSVSRDKTYFGYKSSSTSTGLYFINMATTSGYKCTARIKALTSSMGDDGYILQVGNHYVEATRGSVWNINTSGFYVSNKIGYRFDYWQTSVAGTISNIYSLTPQVTMPASNLTVKSVYYAVGDANRDGKINARDKAAITNIISGKATKTKYADINNDGKVNARDKATLTGIIKGTYVPTA